MAITSIRVLCRMDFPSRTVRLWDGSGPYLDAEGHIWRGVVLRDGLDVIEAAMNGEASVLTVGLSGVAPDVADLAFEEFEAGDVIGSRFVLLTQDCDAHDQPVGAPRTRFTGRIDNIVFSAIVQAEAIQSDVTIECTNRFALRTLTSGSVLSDTDQRLRAALLNPSAAPDRFAERVPVLADKTLDWPRFTG